MKKLILITCLVFVAGCASEVRWGLPANTDYNQTLSASQMEQLRQGDPNVAALYVPATYKGLSTKTQVTGDAILAGAEDISGVLPPPWNMILNGVLGVIGAAGIWGSLKGRKYYTGLVQVANGIQAFKKATLLPATKEALGNALDVSEDTNTKTLIAQLKVDGDVKSSS